MNDSEPEKAVTIKTPEEIRLMYQANQIVAGVLGLLKSRITPGVSTFQLDKWAVTAVPAARLSARCRAR